MFQKEKNSPLPHPLSEKHIRVSSQGQDEGRGEHFTSYITPADSSPGKRANVYLVTCIGTVQILID